MVVVTATMGTMRERFEEATQGAGNGSEPYNNFES
jgi:hypothetical protein